jgi:hypothetical protein
MRSLVKDEFATCASIRHCVVVTHIAFYETDLPLNICDVFHLACAQIVENNNLVTEFYKCHNQVRTNEARTASN